jgi:hypothetical protein
LAHQTRLAAPADFPELQAEFLIDIIICSVSKIMSKKNKVWGDKSHET